MGNVVLIAGGGRIYADAAARFCRSEKSVSEIIEAPYSPEIIRNILSSGHLSALEFDYFLFGVEGFSRVCETQLVRKRMASFMIKSGREELGGKRKFETVIPNSVKDFNVEHEVFLKDGKKGTIVFNADDINEIIRLWYDEGLKRGKPEEDLRYLKPQGTVFRGIIGMNAHALRDFFAQRMCMRAQWEIRSMANRMFHLAREAAPDLFEGAGPKCVQLGYCPENGRQAEWCKEHKSIPTKDEAMRLLKDFRRNC